MRPEPSEHTVAFAGSYAAPGSPGISAVIHESRSGLTVAGAFTGVHNPSFLALHPHEPYLYAVGETSSGTVHAFRIDGDGRHTRLSHLGPQPSLGGHPCHLAIDAEGRWLAVSNYGTGTVALLRILPDGSLGSPEVSVRHSGRGPHRRQDAPHAHSSVFSPDGRFLLVADLGIDRVAVYQVDRDAGSLSVYGEAPTAPGAGPRHLAFHPDGRHLFVANELDKTISLLGWDAGEIETFQTLSTVPDPAPDTLVADIHVSDDGRHVYVSNRGHDSIAVYAFDAAHGLTRTAVRPSGGATPRGFRLAPGGHSVWVANQNSDQIVVMPLLDDGNDIGAPTARVSVPGPSCVVFRRGAF